MGSNPIARSKDLFHIKVLRNKFDYISTSELADYFPLRLFLKPKIPKAYLEDRTIPRVCLAKTLAGSVGSLGLQRESTLYLGIYKPVYPINVFYPLKLVHDAEKWGEVWALNPVWAELQKIICPGELIY